MAIRAPDGANNYIILGHLALFLKILLDHNLSLLGRPSLPQPWESTLMSQRVIASSFFAHKWLRVLFTLPSSQITEEYWPPPFVSRALGHHHRCSQVCTNCFILSLCFSHSSIDQFLRTLGLDCKCFLMISCLKFFIWKGKPLKTHSNTFKMMRRGWSTWNWDVCLCACTQSV